MLGKYAARLLSESVKILLNTLRIFCKLKEIFTCRCYRFSLSTFFRSLAQDIFKEHWEFRPRKTPRVVMNENSWVTHTNKQCIKNICEGWKGTNSRGEKLVQYTRRTFMKKWKINQNIFMDLWIFMRRPLAGLFGKLEGKILLNTKLFPSLPPPIGVLKTQQKQHFFKGSSEVDKIGGWFLRQFMKWNYRTGWIIKGSLSCPSNNPAACALSCV